MMDIAGDQDDPRWMEMETLEAIFPEIRRPQDAATAAGKQSGDSRFAFELELPVVPAEPVTVLFPAASTSGMTDQQPAVVNCVTPINGTVPQPVDSLLVSHLPPLSLKVILPDGYPSHHPPRVAISTTPQWLSRAVLSKLEDDGPRLWGQAGKDMIAYAYIDHVQREAETVFGAVSAAGTLEVDPQHKLAVLDFDINAKKATFEKETFECGVCLDPKKGSKCHKMLDCGHVFCLQCLQDFYNDAIDEGNLSTVRCLTPNCAKERSTADGDSSRRRKAKAKSFVSPSELLQIGLSADMVKRYVTLKYKTELEADKDTIYCPRQWCNGAARSKKHKKPEGFELAESSDEEEGALSDVEVPKEDGGDAEKKPRKRFNPADLLCVCEDCGFAFCSRCLQTWHGEFIRCAPKRNKDELTEEEQASLEYLQLHTSPCPTCNAPAQKTHGCNHMICSRCDTHFCYLCSSWLDPTNPYKHFNQQEDGKVTSCYMRLWELEGGDGDDVGLGFIGGRGPANGNAPNDMDVGEVDWHAADDEEEPRPQVPAQIQQPNADAPAGPAVAREAPLVLRLMDNPAPRPEAPPDPAAGARGGRGAAAPRGRGQGRGAHGAAIAGAGGRGNQVAVRGQGRAGAGADRGRAAVARRARGGQRGRGGGAAAAVARGGGAANQAARQGQREVGEELVAGGADLNPAQEDWVRRFVQMALIDAEDQVEGGDSDSDDDNWRIR